MAAEQLWQNNKSEDDSGDEEVDVEDPAEEEEVGGDHAARSLEIPSRISCTPSKLRLNPLQPALPGGQIARIVANPP